MLQRAAIGWMTTLAIAMHVVAQPASDHLTPHDIARLRMVTDAGLAPDGHHIAYVISVPRTPGQGENGPAWSELHVYDRLAGTSRPFISGEVNVSKIGWTPDGKGVALLMKRGRDKETSLYVIPIDGGEARRLVGLKTAISEYAFRPDGQQVAVIAPEPPPEEKKKLEDQGFNPLVVEENPRQVRIWLADTDPDTDDTPRMLDLPGSASEIHWSPDGTSFAAAFAPSPSIDDYYMFRRLRIVDARTSQITTAIENPGKLGAVRWSPDGKHLAFLSGQDIHDPSEGRLMLANVGDGSFTELLPDYLPNISAIEWLDDARLIYIADDGCLSALGQIDIHSRQRTDVLPAGTPILATLSICPRDRTACMVASTPEHPGELFATSLAPRSEPRRLTQVNPWLAGKKLAKQEVIRYKARDGETIEGVLVHPLDEEPGRAYPLILAVHGGPESHVPNGWVTSYSNPGQVAAAKGIFVLYPNYRGSTGRGVAFAKAHQGDYGGREFDDLIDGIDYLVEKGLVDKARVGVTGGSYGGFATAWCSTYHSERFAAGVMFVGISDHVSKSGTTDIPQEMYLVHARKRPWEDWEFFLKRSPIYYVRKARTPLLILHGQNDTRVPPSQSMELYRHLKVLGQTPVRLVYYPGEGHGNRKAAARLDYNLRMMQWLEHYLLGPGGEPPPAEINYGLPSGEKKSE